MMGETAMMPRLAIQRQRLKCKMILMMLMTRYQFANIIQFSFNFQSSIQYLQIDV